MATLWNKFKYQSPIEYLIDKPIRVFDIRKANISVLADKGYISQDQYRVLYDAEKLKREIYMGNLIGHNPEASKALSEGIIEAKKKFFDSNRIEDNEVLEVDNDAVYIIGSKPIPCQHISSHIYFKLAEVYTSFYKVKDIRYYYYYDQITGQEYLKPKGLGKAAEYHESFMLDFLKELFFTAQAEGAPSAIRLLNNFYNQYVSKQLDIGYYRNLNASSRYSIGNFDKYATYGIDTNDPRIKSIIDISYNEKILREFNKFFSNHYFRGNR